VSNSVRLYLDYNATAPLAESVLELSAKGSFFGANPSSLHSSGKSMRKEIARVTVYLKSIFHLDHNVVFHSGATEGVNSVVYAYLEKYLFQDQSFLYLYSSIDHACVYEQAKRVMHFGQVAQEVQIDSRGHIDLAWLTNYLDKNAAQYKAILLNITWVNSETGIVEDLSRLSILSKFKNLYFHLDAVQSVGKIADWQHPPTWMNYITYSAHKFGALKSIGFTFYKNNTTTPVLLIGGSQQSSVRAGTENVMGIVSIELALQEVCRNFNLTRMQDFQKKFEQELSSHKQLEIVGFNSKRAVNCCALAFKHHNADFVLAHFDMNGMDVSIGSACSSDSVKKSRLLMAMGREDISRNMIRISFGFNPPTNDEVAKIYQAINQLCV
jgi:cysteine desulfurase